MKIKAKTEYAYWALVDLAMNTRRNEPVRLSEISERQRIPEKFLLQVMSALRQAGLVRSVRGQHGGYVLARPPAAITMNDVLRATGVEPVVMRFAPASAKSRSGSSLLRVLQEVDETVEKALTRLTLADALALEVSRNAPNYAI